MKPRIIRGDCLRVLPLLPDAACDSVVTDPPYELGFMGKAWDGQGIAYSLVLWREVLRVLKPGGHLLAFGGTRTYHRMTCAIEDAGFEIRDSLHWMYGTGFPKSLNLGDGRGTALKPGHEPIVLARKPLVGTVAANVEHWGTGALNIDGCRLSTTEDTGRKRGTFPHSDDAWGNGALTHTEGHVAGRWPANVLLDPEAARELDAQSGETKSGAPSSVRGRRAGGFGDVGASKGDPVPNGPQYGDSGGASRFFYVAKPSRKERGEGNTHPTVKPVALMRYLVRLVTPPGGLVLDPFAGSGTTGLAAAKEGMRFIGVEREAEYTRIACTRLQAELFEEDEGKACHG